MHNRVVPATPTDGNPFGIEELGVLTYLMDKAIQKTVFEGRTLGDIHGEIYTRMRQEMIFDGSSFNENVLEILKGKFKNLAWRLSNKQKEQFMTLFNNLSRSRGRMHQAKPEDERYQAPKTALDRIEAEIAKCAAIVADTKQNAQTAQHIAEEVQKLDDFIQEG